MAGKVAGKIALITGGSAGIGFAAAQCLLAFLASDDSSYITGIELTVDGGLAQVFAGKL